jgi:hypothetical protein
MHADVGLDLQHTAGNAAMAQLLGRAPDDPRPIQRYQAPDGDWWGKLGSDAIETGAQGLEAIPGVGNAVSSLAGAGMLGMAGYDAATGDSKDAAARLTDAENFGLNAVPIAGNLRAGGQAIRSQGAVVGDLAGKSPDTNQSGWDKWIGGGSDQFNKGVGDMWGGLF